MQKRKSYDIIVDGTNSIWGISAAGSAFDWQSRGQGFDPPMLHQNTQIRTQRWVRILLYLLHHNRCHPFYGWHRFFDNLIKYPCTLKVFFLDFFTYSFFTNSARMALRTAIIITPTSAKIASHILSLIHIFYAPHMLLKLEPDFPK